MSEVGHFRWLFPNPIHQLLLRADVAGDVFGPLFRGRLLGSRLGLALEHLEAQMVVLYPRGNGVVIVEHKGIRRYPGAVVDADVDMRSARTLSRLARVPGAHVAGRSDRMVAVEDRRESLGVLLSHRFPHMLDEMRDMLSVMTS